MVTQIFPPNHTVGLDQSSPNFTENAKLRLNELLTVLNRKLADERVAAVHIIYHNPLTRLFLTQTDFLTHKYKLVLHQNNKDPSYADILRYASKYLLMKIVVFINQDVYLGEGMEKANDRNLLCQKKVSYALTRHGKQERYCDMSLNKIGYCNKWYSGASDTYVFCLTEPISESLLTGSEIDSKSDSLGMENGWIWLFRHLGFKVLNPCSILKTYHIHCIQLHSKNRPKVKKRRKSALARPSRNLF